MEARVDGAENSRATQTKLMANIRRCSNPAYPSMLNMARGMRIAAIRPSQLNQSNFLPRFIASRITIIAANAIPIRLANNE